MKHVIYGLFVMGLGALGTTILLADILDGGSLHVVSGTIGTGFLLLAITFAIPLKVKTALNTLAPVADMVRSKISG